MPLKFIKPLDIAVVAAVAVLAISLLAITSAIPIFASGGINTSPAEASVFYDGGRLNIPLARDDIYEIESGGYTLEIIVKDRGINISKADCPDRLCVRCGIITRRGQSLICLPARVLIEIKGGDNDADAIAG